MAGKKQTPGGGRKRPTAPAPRQRRAAQAPSARAAPPPARAFPVVGIGASAGGLAAFEAFFKGMPAGADPGMAFVLVQHLAPDHKSLLTELIRRYTRMKVFEVEDGMKAEVNCAYIIPPNRDMAFLHGALHLLEPVAPRGQRLPIDFFFRSLAQDQRERAVGIILSGTGSDGTQGARAIKAEGGLVLAQDPKSTEFDGMPASIIATGLVDFVLPPGQMPAKLIGYSAHAFGRPPRPRVAPPLEVGNALKRILILLRSNTGHDFSQYKPGTTQRRIERRMAIHQIETLDGYVKYAQQTPDEVEALFHDLLIGVTSFFRDPLSFKALAEQVLPALFESKAQGSTVRAWSAGCSTGEEAYSLAMLLAEEQDRSKKDVKVSVFATDIDGHAIAAARAGIYPASLAAELSPERLTRFFTPVAETGQYRVRKHLRDLVVFSEQDVNRDPPFSKLDLISCRNLLIYLGPELQQRLMPLFHFALAPDGYLLLGTSESVGDHGDLFTLVERKQKLYRRKPDSQRARPGPGRALLPPAAPPSEQQAQPAAKKSGKLPLRELTEQALLQVVAPAGALVNAQGDISYLHGRTGHYLEPAEGEAGVSNIVRMAREGLRNSLAGALRKAAVSKSVVRVPSLRVKTNGHFSLVNLTIRPVHLGVNAPAKGPLFLVVLEAAPPAPDAERKPAGSKSSRLARSRSTDAARVAALHRELQARQDDLQTTVEELETTNEELKSSNEEMQSVNEELQSTNEEMETSKEELQSVNEEMATVNHELQAKVAQLSRSNNDMVNLMAGTGIATVFVDTQLNVQRFTPAATQLINLIPVDVGRPLGHIVSNLLVYDRLVEDAQGVLETLVPKEVEVQTKAGVWFQLRIRPYRTLDNQIEGAVITFIDISEIQRLRRALEELKAAPPREPDHG